MGSACELRNASIAFCFLLLHPIASLQSPVAVPATTKAPRYLSDVPTPSILLDLHAMEKVHGEHLSKEYAFQIGDWLVQPRGGTNKNLLDLEDLEQRGKLQRASEDVCFGYIHTSVLEPRREGIFLARIDLPETTKAHLVLGLNNHHVISYYWARSAGKGAGMEAPGISLRQGNRLEWTSDSGFTDCNSNDGKRSEWANFLSAGDQIQLRPSNLKESLELFRDHIYGISSAGRPLGAEPFVVCQFEMHRADE